MFGSEVLDAAAIGAGAALLGGIIAGFFAWITKTQEIRAKRFELAFDKRISAFKEVFDAISTNKVRIEMFKRLSKVVDLDEYAHYGSIVDDEAVDVPKRAASEALRRFMEIDRTFIKEYNKNRVYIPLYIDQEVQKYYYEVLSIVKVKSMREVVNDLDEMIKLHDRYSDNILAMIHKFIGFK